MRRVVARVVAVAVTAVLAAACGSSPSEVRHPASFAKPRLTWAQGSSVHYGARTLKVQGVVSSLQRTSYGLLVGLRSGYGPNDGGRGVLLLDGRRSTELRDLLVDPRVSPDGRYLGFIDRRGPRRLFGRLAQAVVLDLATGKQVLTSRRGMGGAKDDLDDLYEDAEPTFLGFDRRWAYWRPATGDPAIYRARIGTWVPEPGARKDSFGEDEPITAPYDSVVGRVTGMADDGRAAANGDGLIGFVSPTGRWCGTPGGRLKVVDCRTARVATPRYPGSQVFFGGWDGENAFFAAISRDRDDGTIDPPSSDRTTGVLVRCSLGSRACTVLRRVTHLDSLVLPGGGQL